METIGGVVVPEFSGVRSTDSQRAINSSPGMMAVAGMRSGVRGDKGLNRLIDLAARGTNMWVA